MSSFGGLRSPGEFWSAAMGNQKLNHALTGSEIAALTTAQKKKGTQILCTLTESGYTANHLYLVNAAEDALVDLSLESHTHFDVNTGGSLYEILKTNMASTYYYNNLAPTVGAFFTTTGTGLGGTTTSNDDAAGIDIKTNATNGAYATVTLAGIKISFAAPSTFQVKFRALNNTNLTRLRVGIGTEHANEANTTSRKYLMEGCSSSGINWLVGTSDGTTRSTLSTSSPLVTAAHESYSMEKSPSSVIFDVNGATAATKTTNIPTSSDSGMQAFRAGIMNTAAEDKQMRLAGIRIIGLISDIGWDP